MGKGRPDNEDMLSKDPRHIRNRIRSAHRRGDQEILNREMEYLHQATGRYKPVEEWTIEELAHGMPANIDGKFRGKPPVWISDQVRREIKRQLHLKTFGKLASNADVAVQVIVDLMKSEEVDDKGKPVVDARTRLAAAQFVLDHILGKAATILELDPADAAQKVFAAAIVLDNGQVDSHLAIEGVIVGSPEDTAPVDPDDTPDVPVYAGDEDIYEMDDL